MPVFYDSKIVVLQIQSALPAPAGYGPSEDWQRQQTADFFEIRQVGESTFLLLMFYPTKYSFL